MAVTLTADTAIALVDSVTGVAFGEVFPNRDQAEDFLRWLGEGDEPRIPRPLRITPGLWYRRATWSDPRVYGSDDLARLRQLWRDERLDEDGDLK